MELTSRAQLVLLKQTSLVEESITKNGRQKVVHVVVKNSPFHLTFGFNAGGFVMDLHKYAVDVKLLYDAELEKEVDFVKDKPVQFKTSVNQNGAKLSLEVRIKVLTSQLEDMLFRVGVRILEPSTQTPLLSSYSEAVKVISKSDQVKKRKTNRKKRTTNDYLTEALSQIENKQNEHNQLLEHLCEQNESILLDATLLSKECVSRSCSVSPAPDFETAFKQFIRSNSALTNDERRSKIRRVSSATHASEFAELLDLLWTEGLAREIGESAPSHQQRVQSNSMVQDTVCQCAECPHKKELVRIENFYSDIFSLKT